MKNNWAETQKVRRFEIMATRHLSDRAGMEVRVAELLYVTKGYYTIAIVAKRTANSEIGYSLHR
jgi:hypothetical protein